MRISILFRRRVCFQELEGIIGLFVACGLFYVMSVLNSSRQDGLRVVLLPFAPFSSTSWSWLEQSSYERKKAEQDSSFTLHSELTSGEVQPLLRQSRPIRLLLPGISRVSLCHKPLSVSLLQYCWFSLKHCLVASCGLMT
jgi:hypothetical protein